MRSHALVIAVLLLPPALVGAEPLPPVQASVYTGPGHLWQPGKDSVATAFTRLQADAPLTRSVHAIVRGDLSRVVDAEHPETSWTSVEGYLGAYWSLGRVAPTCLYGLSAPIEKGVIAAKRYPYMWGCGATVGDVRGGRWLMVLYGSNEVSGERRAATIAVSWPIRDNAFFMADGAPNGNAAIRTQVAVRWGK